MLESWSATAQIAASTTLGGTVEELKAVAMGWSAKRQILGKIDDIS